MIENQYVKREPQEGEEDKLSFDYGKLLEDSLHLGADDLGNKINLAINHFNLLTDDIADLSVFDGGEVDISEEAFDIFVLGLQEKINIAINKYNEQRNEDSSELEGIISTLEDKDLLVKELQNIIKQNIINKDKTPKTTEDSWNGAIVGLRKKGTKAHAKYMNEKMGG